MIYLLFKKLKDLSVTNVKLKWPICYLKNLKDLYLTNIKFKRHINAFCLKLEVYINNKKTNWRCWKPQIVIITLHTWGVKSLKFFLLSMLSLNIKQGVKMQMKIFLSIENYLSLTMQLLLKVIISCFSMHLGDWKKYWL
jgi:hypothetical protein